MSERIRYELKRRMDLLDLRSATLSKEAGLGPTAVRDILEERIASPTEKTLRALAKRLGCTVGDLTGDLPAKRAAAPQERLDSGIRDVGGVEYISVGRYDAGLSAGPGSLFDPDPEPIGYHLLEAQWLRVVTRAAPEHLAVVRVDGDSMETTLSDGDAILVDLSDRRFGREGIYALRVGHTCWVKRLTLNFRTKQVTVVSDNPRYGQQDVDEGDIDLIGRVVMIVARKV